MKLIRALILCGLAIAITVPVAQAQSAGKKVTYADIQPILKENCMACHRPGEIAPMSLLTYEEVRPWARSVRKEVRRKSMPPWHADPNYSEFRNDISLSKEQIQLIIDWVDGGAPRGVTPGRRAAAARPRCGSSAPIRRTESPAPSPVALGS